MDRIKAIIIGYRTRKQIFIKTYASRMIQTKIRTDHLKQLTGINVYRNHEIIIISLDMNKFKGTVIGDNEEGIHPFEKKRSNNKLYRRRISK